MSQPITVDIPHSLGKDEARRRIADGFAQLRQQMTGGFSSMLKFQDRWEEDRLHFEGSALGQRMTGRLEVNSDSVHLQIDLPEFLAKLADRIKTNLQEQGRKLLEKR